MKPCAWQRLPAVWVLGLLMVVSCGGPSADPVGEPVGLEQLTDENPAVRVRAIKWAGEQRVEQAVPLLVDRLLEHDAAIRFYAIEALERITGDRYGYDYAANALSRRQAVQRWRSAIAGD